MYRDGEKSKMTYNSDKKIFFRRNTLIIIGIIGGSILTGCILIPYVIGHYGNSQIPVCPPNQNETDVNPPVCIPPVKIVHDTTATEAHLLTIKDCPEGVDVKHNKCLVPCPTIPQVDEPPCYLSERETQNTYLSTYDALQLETYMDTEKMLNDNRTELWVSGPYTVCPVSQKDHCQEWYDVNKVIPDDPVFQNLVTQQKLDRILKELNKTNSELGKIIQMCMIVNDSSGIIENTCHITINDTTVNNTAMIIHDQRIFYTQCTTSDCK